MAQQSQKQVVYQAICALLKETHRPFGEGVKPDLSPEDRKTITTMIVTAIETGEMEFSSKARLKHDTPEAIRVYATSLLSNWNRKDDRLNGGIKHSIKKPGSRIGKDDGLLKSLKALKKALTSHVEIQKVNNEIALRTEQLKNEKLSSIKIEMNNIPSYLRYLVKP